jgi:cytochrome c oxidase subunit IV
MAQPSQARLGAQLEHPEKVSGNVGHAGSGTGPENAPHYEDHDDDHTHHVSMKTYYMVFGFLMVALLATVGAAQVDLGKWNIPIALVIAFAKAAAVMLIFMHVKFSSRLVQIFACTGLIFVGIMFLLTFNDYGTRTWLPVAGM